MKDKIYSKLISFFLPFFEAIHHPSPNVSLFLILCTLLKAT